MLASEKDKNSKPFFFGDASYDIKKPNNKYL
jgi:hypothetical protein